MPQPPAGADEPRRRCAAGRYPSPVPFPTKTTLPLLRLSPQMPTPLPLHSFARPPPLRPPPPPAPSHPKRTPLGLIQRNHKLAVAGVGSADDHRHHPPARVLELVRLILEVEAIHGPAARAVFKLPVARLRPQRRLNPTPYPGTKGKRGKRRVAVGNGRSRWRAQAIQMGWGAGGDTAKSKRYKSGGEKKTTAKRATRPKQQRQSKRAPKQKSAKNPTAVSRLLTARPAQGGRADGDRPAPRPRRLLEREEGRRALLGEEQEEDGGGPPDAPPRPACPQAPPPCLPSRHAPGSAKDPSAAAAGALGRLTTACAPRAVAAAEASQPRRRGGRVGIWARTTGAACRPPGVRWGGGRAALLPPAPHSRRPSLLLPPKPPAPTPR